MKKYIMLIAAAVLLMSCGTMKKVQTTNDEYYTAEGIATARNLETARAEARAAALTDLSVQTKVNVNTLTEVKSAKTASYGRKKVSERESAATKTTSEVRSSNTLHGLEWEEYRKEKAGKFTVKYVVRLYRDDAELLLNR